MPDMTKEDPEPEGGSTAVADAPEPVCDGKVCTECGFHHHADEKHYAKRGSRRWFWRKRAENLLLIAAPLIPAGMAVAALLRPGVETPLTDKQAAAINGAYEYATGKPSTVRTVYVRMDDPSIGDRLVAAGPSLTFAVLLGLLAYALWRIEINMSAGARPYTAKDAQVFRRATRWLWTGWWVVLGTEILGSTWYHYGPSGGWFRSGAHVPMDGVSLAVWGLSGMLAVVGRMYTTGARQYAELEKGV
jgi:hypothetical protein